MMIFFSLQNLSISPGLLCIDVREYCGIIFAMASIYYYYAYQLLSLLVSRLSFDLVHDCFECYSSCAKESKIGVEKT